MNDYTPKQLNDLGEAYFTGVGKVQNKELAYTYFKQAADLNNPVGYYNVGRYFVDRADFKNAIDSFTKSKSFRYVPAYLALAELYKLGSGVKKNKKKAFKYYEEAATNQDVDSYLAVAQCFETGYGTKKNIDKAKFYYQKASDLNHPLGHYKIAFYLEQNTKDKNKQDQALQLYDKAALLGEQKSLKRLIQLYEKAPFPSLKKKSEHYRKEMVFYYTELLAKTKDIDALIAVANAYYEGSTTNERSPEKSYQYYTVLVDLDHMQGYFGLANHYFYGIGVKPDRERAKTYYERAEVKGHLQSMTRLGDYYRLRAKDSSDYEQAKDWYLKAAKNQEQEALLNLGLLHYRNQIANSNPQLAYQYFETALKKGATSAHYWLGILTQKGQGTNQSFEGARKHFEKAIEFGNLGARFKLAQMIEEMAEKPKVKAKQKTSLYQKMHQLYLSYSLDSQNNPTNANQAMYQVAIDFKLGRGTSINLRAYRYWLELACMKENPDAMAELYLLLKEKEPKQAIEWLQKASEKNSALAHFEMGKVYQEGFHSFIKVDLKQANHYFELAAKNNHPEAVARVLKSVQ